MEKITVYEKPTCTTCRKTVKFLQEKGYNFNRINYYVKPFSKTKIRTLLRKMGIKPGELLRKSEPAYKKLYLKKKDYTDEQLLEIMIKDHNLIQRPIVELGDKAVLARPIDKIDELFK
ncbi:MAG: Spx/MgsR family RNA polymerase-binding regulatory protein [Melioribacteraceae bacterium]|nr:Spx/MgsR family RNA polymerase-binding regulatory protein [Melioribacteraceae bacterium]